MLDLTQPFLEKGDKVVCLGDSLTAGENSYVKYLQELLPDNTVTVSISRTDSADGRMIEIVNAKCPEEKQSE